MTQYYVAVHDNVYRKLLLRFKSGERNLYTGKKDGTNRPVKMLADGRIVEKRTNGKTQIIPMKMLSILLKNNMKMLNGEGKYADWAFVRWLYDDSGKPIGKRYRNCKNGKFENMYY